MARKRRRQRLRSIRSPYSPLLWPSWCGVGLLWLLTQLPYPLLIVLGRGLGRLAYYLLPARRHVARVNLCLCFPDLGPRERESLVRQHFESLGIALFEIGLAWWASDARLRPRVRIEGLEHLDAALAAGHGALLLIGHLTALEIIGRLLALERKFAPMYRPHENPVVERMLSRNRDRHTLAAIPRDEAKRVIRALRENLPVWYAPDQAFRKGGGTVLAPFFGVPAHTNNATPRLAKVAGSPVLPFFGYRLAAGGGYRLIIGPPLEDFPGTDLDADVARINAVIEDMVRHAPEQYLWIHRRFKRSRKEPDPYGESPVACGRKAQD